VISLYPVGDEQGLSKSVGRTVGADASPCPTEATIRLRMLIAEHRSAIDDLLDRYHARNLRLFGSVARGDASDASDIDILVDIEGTPVEVFMRSSGLMQCMRDLLKCKVDIFPPGLLKEGVSVAAEQESVPL